MSVDKEAKEITFKSWVEIIHNTKPDLKDRNHELLTIIVEEIFAFAEKIEKDYSKEIKNLEDLTDFQDGYIKRLKEKIEKELKKE